MYTENVNTNQYFGTNSGATTTLYNDNQNQDFSLKDIETKLGFTGSTVTTNEEVNPDLRPSDSTFKMSYSRNYEANPVAKTKTDTRTKVMVASYIAVVLALVVAATLCGVAVTSSFAGNIALSEDLATATEDLAEIQQVVSADDYAVLSQRAAELGYSDITLSNTQTYTQLETRPAQNFNVETNWFDALCDWVSNVLGE